MGIENKIDGGVPDGNCFECDGTNTKCKTYYSYEHGKCLYKTIADSDIKKYILGIKSLALEQMFDEYKEILRQEHETKK